MRDNRSTTDGRPRIWLTLHPGYGWWTNAA